MKSVTHWLLTQLYYMNIFVWKSDYSVLKSSNKTFVDSIYLYAIWHTISYSVSIVLVSRIIYLILFNRIWNLQNGFSKEIILSTYIPKSECGSPVGDKRREETGTKVLHVQGIRLFWRHLKAWSFHPIYLSLWIKSSLLPGGKLCFFMSLP